MTTTPEPITLQAVLARYGITKVKDLAQRAGLSKQHAWGLMRATIGVGKVAAKRLHDTLGIPTDELLAVAEVPCWEKRQALAGRTPRRPKARPGRKPQYARPAPEPPAPVVLSPQARKAAMLAQLQQMKTAGMTLQAMANRLNTEGVPTLSGRRRWQPGAIGNLLAEVRDEQPC
jgi:transcriptional regulator with XRE-family HTH domain